MSLHAKIDNVFRYHPPTPDQVRRYGQIRDEARSLAHAMYMPIPEGDEEERARAHDLANKGGQFERTIRECCPESDERQFALFSLNRLPSSGGDALFVLRSVVMWANAAIACNEPGADAPVKQDDNG